MLAFLAFMALRLKLLRSAEFLCRNGPHKAKTFRGARARDFLCQPGTLGAAYRTERYRTHTRVTALQKIYMISALLYDTVILYGDV